MQYISSGLSVLVMMILVNGIIALLRKPVKVDDYTVALPKFLLVIGMICSTAFLIPAVIILVTNGSVALTLTFMTFSLLSASLIIAFVHCRIIYDEESFTAKNFWGIKRSYSYKEITAIQGNTMDVKLHIGKHIVRIDAVAMGKREFLAYARKQYRKHNNGNPIPTATPKTDVFKGNVENPGEFIFVYVLIGALCVGMIILFAVVSSSSTDLEYATLSFVRYETKEDALHLYVSGDSMHYVIPAYKELLNDTNSFVSSCAAGESFSVGYVLYDEADVPHYGIENIVGADETVFLTSDAVHDYRGRNAWAFYLIFGGLSIIWFAFVFISVYVGRHPEKFSRRFIRLFFKDGYVRTSKDVQKR